MKTLCLIILSIALLEAQQPLVAIHPLTDPSQQSGPTESPEIAKTPARRRRLTVVAGLPIAGYIPGNAPATLTSVALAGRAPILCGMVKLPPATNRLYVPPRQMYALVESSMDNPMSVWPMHLPAIADLAKEAVAITGSVAHPDMVIFSALGDSALLYSAATGKLQLLRSIPSNTYATDMPSIGGIPLLLAVSDDAAVVVALLNDGRMVFSWNREAWKPLYLDCTPSNLLFLPHTHDLIINDATNMTITDLPLAIDGAGPPRVMLQNKRVDELAAGKDGTLLAVNTVTGELSLICMKTGAAVSRDQLGPIHEVLALRDGVTFLVSTGHGLSVLKIPSNDDGTATPTSDGDHHAAIYR